jgi:DNA topoisomerase IA
MSEEAIRKDEEKDEDVEAHTLIRPTETSEPQEDVGDEEGDVEAHALIRPT